METREKPTKNARGQDWDKQPSNWKSVALVFGLTGIISLVFWTKGKMEKGGVDGMVSTPLTLSYSVEVATPEEKKLANNLVDLIKKINNITANAKGDYSWYVWRLDSKSGYGNKEMVGMPALSILKIPVILSVLDRVDRKQLSLDDVWELEEADRAPGSGPLFTKPIGYKITIDGALELLGKNSDNTAWVMFERRLGKDVFVDKIDKLGMSKTDYEEKTSTAVDIAKLWGEVYRVGKLDTGKADLFSRYLSGSIYEDILPVAVGSEIKLWHKMGIDIDVWADSGIVMNEGREPFVIVILNDGVDRDEAKGKTIDIAKNLIEFENKRQ